MARNLCTPFLLALLTQANGRIELGSASDDDSITEGWNAFVEVTSRQLRDPRGQRRQDDVARAVLLDSQTNMDIHRDWQEMEEQDKKDEADIKQREGILRR